jgi:glycosyltransferase involved in cell wall biosynthesis
MKLSIIIPVYNEAPMAGELLRRVMAAPLPPGVAREVIVVDDGSDEATRAVLAALRPQLGFSLFRLVPNQGKGAALREGIARCTGEIVLFQDCDLEYDPQDYLALIAPIVAGESDAVYGSRFARAAHPEITPVFRAANRLLTSFSNLCSGLQVTDMETGYKAFRAPILRRITLTEPRFGVEPEITAKLARLVRREGLRLAEVPVRYTARGYRDGKKIKARDGLRAVWCILKFNLFGAR